MNILEILTTQRSLNRKSQLHNLVIAIKNNEQIEPITIFKTISNELILHNGHHRLAAYFLAGRKDLYSYEYELLYKDECKFPVFGTIKNFIGRS